MKKTKILAIAAVIGASLTLGACSNGNQVIVKTDVGNITQNDFYQTLKTNAGPDILKEIILEKYLQEKYTATDKEIQAQIDQIKLQQGFKTDADLEKALKTNFITMDEFKHNMKIRVLLSKAETNGVKVPESEIKAEYDKEKTQVKASHILVASESTAKEVLTKLKAGQDFASLAKEYSTDTSSATKGGDVGFIAKGQMVPEFEKAAFALQVGKYTTAPIKSQYGYHIIEVTDRKDYTYDQLKSKIETKLKQQHPKSIDQTFGELIKGKKIEFTDSRYNTLLDSIKNPPVATPATTQNQPATSTQNTGK